MAAPSVTYTFSNSTTADATQVNTNFTDLVNSLSDGLKDLTISSLNTATLTVSGAATFNGTVALGNATTDDVTITGYIASDILPKTTGTASLGSATQAWEDIYLDEGATNGGSVYFNAGTTSYIQSNAAGTILTIGGFTSMVPPAAINAAGALTIGTNGSTTALTLSTAQLATFAGAIALPNSISTDGQINFANSNSATKLETFPLAVGTIYLYGASDTLYYQNNGSADILKMTASTKAVTLGGLLDISGSTAGQIKFPSGTSHYSSNANTLDDYEESAYTITDQSGAGLSITNNEISYTKIGNIVHFNFYITYPATANGSNSTISIPFTSTGYGTAICRSTYANTIFAWINSGATTLNFFTNGNVQLTNANLSTLLIQCSITYEVAT